MENMDHLTGRLLAILPFILKDVLFMSNFDYCQKIFGSGISLFVFVFVFVTLVISTKDLLMNCS